MQIDQAQTLHDTLVCISSNSVSEVLEAPSTPLASSPWHLHYTHVLVCGSSQETAIAVETIVLDGQLTGQRFNLSSLQAEMQEDKAMSAL